MGIEEEDKGLRYLKDLLHKFENMSDEEFNELDKKASYLQEERKNKSIINGEVCEEFEIITDPEILKKLNIARSSDE